MGNTRILIRASSADPAAGQSCCCAILGQHSGTHVGGSLVRAARGLGFSPLVLDATEADSRHRLVRAWHWHVRGHRPAELDRFSRSIEDACAQYRPPAFIATGAAPATSGTLAALREMGIVTLNFSTDDPLNQAHRANWHLDALKQYDVVFTPRRANIEDLRGLGCRDVRYLPFAYDPDAFGADDACTGAPPDPLDVLFVGGADSDRISFVKQYLATGPRPALAGGYWERDPVTRPFSIGLTTPGRLGVLTRTAKVNVCLVRRANRDGHVMRSFEIPAIGGFMIAEDTAEHRELFGDPGKAVLYFRTPQEAAELALWAIAHPDERRRMALASHNLIVGGHHTYRDRLVHMLAAASEITEQRACRR